MNQDTFNPSSHLQTSDPDSQLEAYALGALDDADRIAVEQQLAQSPSQRAELRRLREVVAILPYAAAPAEPPERVREQLFARIAASKPAPAPARSPAPRRSWLMPSAVAVLTVLLIIFGGMTISLGQSIADLDRSNRQLVGTLSEMQQVLAETQNRQRVVESQLSSSRQEIENLNARLAQDHYVVSFVSAPGVATRSLKAVSTGINASGEMYMYPGEASAVVVFSGLPDLEAGKVYQFWLADTSGQVPGGTFVVDDSGIASLVVEAPREVNAFQQVMLTIEPDGGSDNPSQQVVLEGSL
jgi:anti-sigma-K factor RskA